MIGKKDFWKTYSGSVRKGAVFIYPTDTVYGIGCDATNKKAVERVRRIKGTKHPFSVIAPSKKWIKENLIVLKEHKKYIRKLPGPYTFILKMKKKCVASNVSYSQSVGVRIPKHWTGTIAAKLGVPIVTTSANVSGEPTIREVSEIPKKLKADFVIDGGKLGGRPSRIIDLTGSKPRKVR